MIFDPIVQAIILGILQGLTEFLPISSSAHLVLVPWMMGWEPMGIIFDVMIHGGTLIAVLIYFRKDWQNVTIGMFKLIQGKPDSHSRLAIAIIVGTIPAIIAALLFREFIENYARVPIVTVVTLSFFGAILWTADRKGKSDCTLQSIGMKTALIIGTAQALALIPGVSRSAITISAGLFLGYSRTDSARFSFLLSGPIIFLGSMKGILELIMNDGSADQLGFVVIVLAVFVSALTGYLCIKYFLNFLKTNSFTPFVVYRFLLAGVILLMIIY
jgi:undecaprenyl-diphosphatase